MKKFLVSFILVLILCGVSSADIAYTTTNGGLGLVQISSSTSSDLEGIQYSGTVSEPVICAYKDYNSNRYVMLLNRTTDTNTNISGDSYVRFSSKNLSSPYDSETKYLAGLYNSQTYEASNNGRSLFFTSGSKIYDFDTNTMKMRTSFDCASGDNASVVNIAVNEVIYALVDSDGVSGDVLMRFDGRLTSKDVIFRKWNVNNTSTNIALLNSSYKVAISHGEGVDVLNNLRITRAVSTDYPVIDVCRDSGGGFFYATQRPAGENYIYTISHYTGGINAFSDIVLNSQDDFFKMLRDDTKNVLAVMTRDSLRIFNTSSGNLIASYSSSQLGGNPFDFAVTNSTLKNENSSSNSGCEISISGMILLLACTKFFHGRKMI